MNIKNKRILEALQMQPLSPEEMASRHILGRLYGPIATCIESTRNGRFYNKPLWEKALKDEIFLEKVATKALFLELGHPEDREETDMKQACACIPEVPKIVGDDLFAYVDILDTPNGRLLKTLVDYGFVPGISSRGSGDVMENNQVDPETFFLETWDIVQLPAVKKARLNVCESLDSDSLKLKKALAESYKAAKEEDKDTMKKALENLNIDINKELQEAAIDDIPWDTDDEDYMEEQLNVDEENIPWDDEESFEDKLFDKDKEENIPWDEGQPLKEEAEEESTEDSVESSEEDTADSEVGAEEIENVDTDTELGEIVSKDKIIDNLRKALEEYSSEELDIDFKPIVIDEKEYNVTQSTFTIEDNVITIGVDCAPTDEAGDTVSYIADEPNKDELPEEDSEQTDEDTEQSADDDGDTEVIESLKEMIRQKESLENEVSALRNDKAVGDAKVEELQETLSRYKRALKQIKPEVDKVPELQKEVEELTEALKSSKTKIETLTEKVNNARQLKESVDVNKKKVSQLTEEVSRLTQKSETLEAKLEGQTKQFTEKLQERTELAKSYKMRFIETLNKYVDSKASMLGVRPSEITSRLNENYTLADVDAVCDQILDSTINFGRLPFSGRTKTSARITESITKTQTNIDPEYGYEIDDALLELAGLKK